MSKHTECETKSSFEVYREGGSTLEIRFTMQLVLVARRWRALLDERLRPIDQSSARMEAMSAIMNAPSPSSQIDIAKRLRIEGPTMTRMIDALSRDGLVQRTQAPTDRRTKYLNLTPKGHEALEDIFDLVEMLRTRLLSSLSDEQIDELNRIFSDMLLKLDKGLPPEEGE
ncbi:MAG TPA: MarR family transcriptional regulator [Alteraurantiacibacter sp.]|jgi:MarR family transcriptional regulator for hemolysin